jgi:hypothetical protein
MAQKKTASVHEAPKPQVMRGTNRSAPRKRRARTLDIAGGRPLKIRNAI